MKCLPLLDCYCGCSALWSIHWVISRILHLLYKYVCIHPNICIYIWTVIVS